MGYFSNFVGETSAEFAQASDFDDMIEQREEKDDLATAPAYQEIQNKRIPRVNLDNCYYTDSLTFGMLNRKTQKIMRAGSTIVTEKKSDSKKWDEFFMSIGKIGQRYTLEGLQERIYLDMFKFGYGYVEFIFDEAIENVVDLKPLDARSMDWARDSNQNIVFNKETQRPLGYTVKLDQSSLGEYLGDEVPEGYSVTTSADQIFILAIRVAAFPLFTFGNGFESVGLIEPSYLSKTRKDKIVEAVTNELYIAGSNPIYAILGDNNRKPSKQQKKRTLDAIQNFRHSSATVFEYPTQINTLDVKHSEQYQEIIRLLKADQSNSAGLPLAILDNTSDIPRSALNQMRQDMDISDQAIVDKFTQNFNKQVLDFISEVNGYGQAKLVWGDISSDDTEAKAKLLLDAAKSGTVITADSAVKVVNKIMNIELEPVVKEEIMEDGEESNGDEKPTDTAEEPVEDTEEQEKEPETPEKA